MWLLSNDFSKALGILIVSASVIYFLGGLVAQVYYIILLGIVWRTNKDYLWAAVMFIMLNTPGGLFHGGTTRDATQSLPIYVLGPISFQFIQLYSMLIFVKALIKHQSFTFVFKQEYKIGAFVFIFLVLVSFYLGVNFEAIKKIYFIAISLSLYYSTLFIFRREEYVIQFLRIIFPFAFVALLLQVYTLINEQQLVALFKPGVVSVHGIVTGEMTRPIEMTELLLLCTVGSLYFLSSGRYGFNRKYLIIISAISILSIFLTGTRSWFLGYAGLFFVFILANRKQLKRSLQYMVIGFILVILLLNFSGVLSKQFNIAWSRISTIENFIEQGGAGAELKRTDERLPKLIEGIKKSTIVTGVGFGELYLKYGDAHLGYINMFFVAGITGYIFYIYFLVSIWGRSLMFASQRSLILRNEVRNILLSLTPILIINSATQFFGFSLGGFTRVFVIALIFAWLNAKITDEFHNDKFEYNHAG